MKKAIWTLCGLLALNSPVRGTAPTNQAELDARIGELRQQYASYLRSLPEPLPARERWVLPTEWKFVYEAKESPKVEGIPPAPAWQGVGFDDAKWETTTVPEWRYRTREGDDTARDPQKVDVWKNSETTADTICWYRTTFRAARPATGKRLWLCFDGVDWEAQVWLNGEWLGTHRVYYESFRFDVTDQVKETNTLAVRVIAGRSYGQPMTYWGLLPDIRAAKQRYVPDRARSIPGNLPIGYHAGCGFGIFRVVYLEQTGPVRVSAIFARNDLSDGNARVKVELDRADARPVELQVELLPENCAGRSYRKTVRCESNVATVGMPMPEAKVWSPESPNLYRGRVTVKDSDAKDVLFGCRSFTIVHRQEEPAIAPTHAFQPVKARWLRIVGRANNASEWNSIWEWTKLHYEAATPKQQGLPSGMCLLNGKPVYLRGTNIQGFNAYAYWGQTNELLHALLLLKAGNFNAVRSCQHVEFPEVLALMDRVGMMSEQDQGGGYRGSLDMGIRREQHIHTGTVLARQTYNNPGVVLLCFGNEHEFPAEPIVRAALAVDPQRIVKPISGRFSHSGKPWDLPEDLRANALDDGHPYSGWYGKVVPQTWSNLEIFSPRRLVTLGEFGAEALDAYETMRDHYPPQFKPPAPDTDTLWAASQVQKHDVKQIVGLGRNPQNLGEYIEASQNYQEAVLADKTIGMRLSPRAVAGYFHFHFMDVVPVFWPKSIVSHDHKPKKAYYQLAQINQPIVALPQLTGAKPDAMTLWVANDLADAFPQATLCWTLSRDGLALLEGQQQLDVPALGAVAGEKIDLLPVVAKHPAFDLTLTMTDAHGRLLARYQRTVRAVPAELLKTEMAAATGDPER
ncbi:MAG: hypothetical protein A2W31_09820 [Planctomycetes bacterium RBG_16_64_10]|nr:MAG: hypothetical protein A2W31_09820 [Planctomycetes bacterium RBG_16_64_10]